MSHAAHALAALLAARQPGVIPALVADARIGDREPLDRTAFEAAFASAARRLGTEAVGAGARVADDTGREWTIAVWGVDEIGRTLLLLEALPRLPASEQTAWVDACYRQGALRERQAVLRGLALLPDPVRFLAIALDGCRQSTQPIFEAIACENPYPAAHLPESSFNQMVLKSVFTGVALERILDLNERLSPELERMARAYASERRAAGRSVPADLVRLTGAGA